MKNLTFISIKQVLVCCISILLLSCSSDAKYSCNPEVEKWARTNIDKYVTATRSEIVELSMDQQRAILRGLPADKKANLWREKLAYIMQDSKLSEEEKQEVKNIYDYFIPYFYSRMDSKKRKNMQRNGLTICKRHIIGITIWYITIFLHG